MVDRQASVHYCQLNMKIDAHFLRILRTNAGYSQRGLAEVAGISHSHLSYIENEEREPRERVIKKIADALGVSVAELVQQP